MAAASDDAAMLALFERLALEAGPVIMGVFDAGMTVSEKSDHSPVTQADRLSEKLILAGLRERFPSIPCVAEEEVSCGLAPAALGPVFFLIDPLDGTREFINKRPDFTVNIALVRDGVPVVGVVYSPCARRLWAGRPGHAEVVEMASDGTVSARGRYGCAGARGPAPSSPAVRTARPRRTTTSQDRRERHRFGRLVAEILPVASERRMPTRASVERWSGIRRPATRSCGQQEAL